jgi:hypothetical protein
MHAVRIEPNLDIGSGSDRLGFYPGDKRAGVICMKKNVHRPPQRFDHVDAAFDTGFSCRNFPGGLEEYAFRPQAEDHILTDRICQKIGVLMAYQNP